MDSAFPLICIKQAWNQCIEINGLIPVWLGIRPMAWVLKNMLRTENGESVVMTFAEELDKLKDWRNRTRIKCNSTHLKVMHLETNNKNFFRGSAFRNEKRHRKNGTHQSDYRGIMSHNCGYNCEKGKYAPSLYHVRYFSGTIEVFRTTCKALNICVLEQFIAILEQIQRRAAKVIRGMRGINSLDSNLKEPGLLNLAKWQLRQHMTVLPKSIKRVSSGRKQSYLS